MGSCVPHPRRVVDQSLQFQWLQNCCTCDMHLSCGFFARTERIQVGAIQDTARHEHSCKLMHALLC